MLGLFAFASAAMERTAPTVVRPPVSRASVAGSPVTPLQQSRYPWWSRAASLPGVSAPSAKWKPPSEEMAMPAVVSPVRSLGRLLPMLTARSAPPRPGVRSR